MKSIRWSLAVYFLVLLALALGAVSALVYRTTRQSLIEKEQSTHALLLARYEGRRRLLEEHFDSQLVRRARTLARMAQSQWGRNPMQEIVAWNALDFLVHPQGAIFFPTLIAETAEGRFVGRAAQRPSIHFAEDVMPGEDEGTGPHYFQVYSEQGDTLQRSQSLGEYTLTLAPELRADLGLLETHYDDDRSAAGTPLRVVTLKTPVSRFRVQRGPPMWWLRSGAPRLPGPASPDRSPDRAVPSIFIQCAADTQKRDQDLVGLQKDLDSDLARLEAQSQTSLAALRTHLLWICLASLAATTVGGCWLIGVGLSPLRRLSDAVSRVSAKDFRLPLDGAPMPAELRPIVERLTQALELLRRAFAREKQAAADISHELRTPLAALLTTIEVALRKPRSSERYEELLQECQAIGMQMNLLVERLLALARLDAGADQVRPQQVNVAELARQSLAMVRPLAETRGLDLHISCPESVHLSTDPDKLREILTNLLHNAIEYNRPGGQVDLSVERHDGHLRFDVRDTGVGIPSEAQAQIFERFYRADPSRQANGLHAGLGLAIVRGYVQLLGGTVDLESKEGQGSVFRVELPAQQGSSF